MPSSTMENTYEVRTVTGPGLTLRLSLSTHTQALLLRLKA